MEYCRIKRKEEIKGLYEVQKAVLHGRSVTITQLTEFDSSQSIFRVKTELKVLLTHKLSVVFSRGGRPLNVLNSFLSFYA